jgi:hypothetical protein
MDIHGKWHTRPLPGSSARVLGGGWSCWCKIDVIRIKKHIKKLPGPDVIHLRPLLALSDVGVVGMAVAVVAVDGVENVVRRVGEGRRRRRSYGGGRPFSCFPVVVRRYAVVIHYSRVRT